MPRFTNSIIQVSSVGNFETEINKLYKRLISQANKPPNTFNRMSSILPINNKKDYVYSDLLTYNNNSRVMLGLKALEMASVVISGVPQSRLFLFEDVKNRVNISNFLTSDSKKMRREVISTLGMSQIVDSVSSEYTEQYKEVCLNIGKLVKAGIYTRDRYSNFIRVRSRDLVKQYLSII